MITFVYSSRYGNTHIVYIGIFTKIRGLTIAGRSAGRLNYVFILNTICAGFITRFLLMEDREHPDRFLSLTIHIIYTGTVFNEIWSLLP